MKRLIALIAVPAALVFASPAHALQASAFADLSNQTPITPLATPTAPSPSGNSRTGVQCSVVGQSSPFQATLTDGTVVTVVAQQLTCTKFNKQGVRVATEPTIDFEIVG